MKKPTKYRRKLKSTRTEYDGLLIHKVTTQTLLNREPIDGSTFARLDQWANGANLPDYLSRLREWASDKLRAANLPDDLRVVEIRPGKKWKERPNEWETWTPAQTLEHFMPDGGGMGTVRDLAKESSIEWHAARILSHAEEMESAITRGDAKEAALCGIRLGEEWQRAIFAEHFELPALIGMSQQEKGKSGTRKRIPSSVREEWQRKADKLWCKNPKWSKSNVARHIDGGLFHTVRKHIKKS